jgi:hypothetical protein
VIDRFQAVSGISSGPVACLGYDRSRPEAEAKPVMQWFICARKLKTKSEIAGTFNAIYSIELAAFRIARTISGSIENNSV